MPASLSIPALDLPLDARLHRPAQPGSEPLPLVILVHGFKGFMDWGPWPWLAEQLTASGRACLRFNFSHNGIGADPQVFTEYDRFAANTFSREVAELQAVIQAGAALPGIDAARISLLGHSLGGAIALLAAAGSATPVRQIITWAGLAGLEGLLGFSGQLGIWRQNGFVEVRNARTGQIMRLGLTLLEDWEQHQAALDVALAMARLVQAGTPVTAIHGTLDPAVAPEHGRRLQRLGAELELIQGADHTFCARHPFQAEPPAELRAALARTLASLR